MEIIGFLLLFFLVYVVVRAAQLWWQVRKVLRGAQPGGRGTQQRKQYTGEGVFTEEQAKPKGAKPKKKVIGDDEGEYVSYEEV